MDDGGPRQGDRKTGRQGDRETGRLPTTNYQLPILVLLAALALYVRTGAPSILGGDQGEHQYTAYLVGVPHATGYPLFTMINALAVRVLPFGDVARRATLMTAVWSALAVALTYVVARRLSGRTWGGLIAASTLALSPEFWSLSTIAEVYSLQACFILIIWWCLLRWWEAPTARNWLFGAALCAGLATTHHGSFVPIVVPAILLVVGLPLLRTIIIREGPRTNAHVKPRCIAARPWALIAGCVGWGIVGLAPWLYLAAQFVLYRPFDYYRGAGLPYHYYWGYPTQWSDLFNLALGGGFRDKVFTHGWEHLLTLTIRFARALRREMWWSGFLLGALGGVWLLMRHPRAGWFSALIFVGAALFGINVAGDIPKAHVYYLPAYVIWSVWAGVGASWLLTVFETKDEGRKTEAYRANFRLSSFVFRPFLTRLLIYGTLIALFALPIGRGWRNLALYDRSRDNAPRQLATAVLANVAPNAVILCRWELCQPIRYLQFVEGQRLDIILDQTEPEAGSDWAERAALYLPTRPVYALQFNQQLADAYPVEQVLTTEDLWRIQKLDVMLDT